jgi:hypothetical protein
MMRFRVSLSCAHSFQRYNISPLTLMLFVFVLYMSSITNKLCDLCAYVPMW